MQSSNETESLFWSQVSFTLNPRLLWLSDKAFAFLMPRLSFVLQLCHIMRLSLFIHVWNGDLFLSLYYRLSITKSGSIVFIISWLITASKLHLTSFTTFMEYDTIFFTFQHNLAYFLNYITRFWGTIKVLCSFLGTSCCWGQTFLSCAFLLYRPW